jgi:GNAT superfamily N-acetyltransferase
VITEWDGRGVDRLVAVSEAAQALFTAHGVLLPDDDASLALRAARTVLVASAGAEPVGFAAVGFAAVTELDGHAHLAELAVHPDHGRRGIGGALLAEARGWAARAGFRALTLTTFRDLPWNAPWYRRHGYREFPRADWGPGLRAQWAAEEATGIVVAPRIAMITDW